MISTYVTGRVAAHGLGCCRAGSLHQHSGGSPWACPAVPPSFISADWKLLRVAAAQPMNP